MNPDASATLMVVLEEIGYEGDRVLFVQKFLALCHFQACWSLVARLSPVDQEQIKKKIPIDVTPKALHGLLTGWFTDRDYAMALADASKRTFSSCFRGMIAMLSEAKQHTIQDVLMGNRV